MRVVLTGASGQLGFYVWRRLIEVGHEVKAWGGSQYVEGLERVDLRDPEAMARALRRDDPDLILHAAAMSSADQVRIDPVGGRAVNVGATARLAQWCRENGRRLVYTSTDLVFGGSKPWNREDDRAEPGLTYGMTKLEAEPSVLAVPGGLAARLSLLYGPSPSARPTYFDRTIDGWERDEPQTFFEDEFRTPLDLATAALILARLAESGASGLIHVGGLERLSRFELALRVATALGFDPDLVRANRQRDVTFPELRPADVSLDTGKLAALLPDLHRPRVEEAVATLWGRTNSETGETRT